MKAGRQEKSASETTIRSGCKLLLECKWEEPCRETMKAVATRMPAAANFQVSHRHPFNPDDSSHNIRSAKIRKAEEAARVANMS